MNDFRNALILAAHEMEEERNRAHDLWTHLPSYRDARYKFGDYADEHMPSIADIMYEAALYLGCEMNVNNIKDPREAEEWFTVEDVDEG